MKASVPELIIISDNESDDGNSEAKTTSTGLEPISWNEVQDQLLLLVKNCSLRNDHEVVATLLRDLAISPLIDVRCALQFTCEKLGELLVFLRNHDRRYRACENLVMVMCEVLSLVQTVPYKGRKTSEPWMKKEAVEIHTVCPMDVANQLMDKWRALLTRCTRSRDGRLLAIGSALSRLETMSAKCLSDIERFQASMVKYEKEIKSATDEWAETMRQCRCDLEPAWDETNEREWKVFDDTFNRTAAVQMKFDENNKGRKSLVHRIREKELCRGFYRASLTLVNAVTLLSDMQGQEGHQYDGPSEEAMSLLSTDMLNQMETYCCALENVMAMSSRQCEIECRRANVVAMKTTEQVNRAELINFSKRFETFWVIYRSWLPPGMLDLVTRSFTALCEVNAHGKLATLDLPSECPLSNAICRVCVCLQADR